MQTRTLFTICLFFGCMGASHAQHGDLETSSRQRELLSQFDEDGDGRLSIVEFEAAAKHLGILKQMTWTVEGQKREALVFLPRANREDEAPVVFSFHGHGGMATDFSRGQKLHRFWPDAIVVYMQGLPVRIGRVGQQVEEHPGWQPKFGKQNNRDLKFFDAVLKTLRTEYNVDDTRIYASGFSLGGRFTYLLWCHRPDTFAAIAPCSIAFPGIADAHPKPIPVFHAAGKLDKLIPIERQRHTMQLVRQINQCENEGESWENVGTLFPSAIGTPLVSYVYDGGHGLPRDASVLTVKFLRQYSKRTTDEKAGSNADGSRQE